MSDSESERGKGERRGEGRGQREKNRYIYIYMIRGIKREMRIRKKLKRKNEEGRQRGDTCCH